MIYPWKLLWLRWYRIAVYLIYRWRLWIAKPILRYIDTVIQRSTHMHVDNFIQVLTQQLLVDAKQKLVNINQLFVSTYHTNNKPLGLLYQSPRTIEQSITLLTKLAPIFDGYLKRSDHYCLLPILAYHYTALWPEIAKCVRTPNNISLEHVTIEDLGTNGLLEALAVFTAGIVAEDIPNHYLSYVGGLDERALLTLFSDLNTGTLSVNSDNPWPSILGQALQYSALQLQSDTSAKEQQHILREHILHNIRRIIGD